MPTVSTEKRISRPVRMAVLGILGLAVYLVTFLLSYQNVQSSLYRERAANTVLLMEKITQNVETGMDAMWKNVHHFANQFVSMEVGSTMEAANLLIEIQGYRRSPDIATLFLVDRSGTCYSPSNRTFKWGQPEMLSSGRDEVYISDSGMEITDANKTYIYFLTPLPEPVIIDGVVLSHMGLTCEMSYIDAFFDTMEYGGDSVAFVIRATGSRIYRQDRESPITGAFNVLSALSRAEYRYGTSYDQLAADIADNRNGCAYVEYDGARYYAAYHGLEANDWVALLLVPAEMVGVGTAAFMQSVVVTILILSMGATAILIILVISTNRRVNRQLVKAVEAERSANAAKTKFLSSMSHDIRTPMNAVIGMTMLASKNLDDPEYAKTCLDKVTLASNHLLTLINDVLDISKVESGRMTLNPANFSLAGATAKAINIILPQLNEKEQDLRIRLHGVVHEDLYADELRLNQIVINLLTNAVKYTPEKGRITVSITEEMIPGDAGRVRLTYVVEDTGIGMTEEFQKTMYRSFARADGERISSVQGSGLGLAICKQMVELMDGTIRCESEVGRGTKFTVTLDLPLGEQCADRPVLPEMRLLLVDSDETFLKSAGETLRSMGVEPHCVYGGEEAVCAVRRAMARGEAYSVIIIDRALRGRSSLDTTRELRALAGEGTVIALCAYEQTDIREVARAAGANGVIAKPFFPSVFCEEVTKLQGAGASIAMEEERTPASVEGMHLLVAEDHDLNWEIASAILEMYGMTAVRAENGRACVETIEAAGEGEFDLILMDIQMPEMNGYEATAAIRGSRRSYVRSIPIIAMTANAFADDIQKCYDAGMNGHIAKPIDVNNLLAIIGNRGGGGVNPLR